MAQVLEGYLSLELQFEWHGLAAIGAGHHTHLHHQIAGFGAGVNQLAADGEVLIALGQGIGLRSLGIQCARLPHPHQLKVQGVFFFRAGVHHPEMGHRKVEMAAHQGEQAAQHHRVDFRAVLTAQHPAGELLRVGRHIGSAHNTDGPVLHRLGDRGNGVLTHRFGRRAVRWDRRPM